VDDFDDEDLDMFDDDVTLAAAFMNGNHGKPKVELSNDGRGDGGGQVNSANVSNGGSKRFPPVVQKFSTTGVQPRKSLQRNRHSVNDDDMWDDDDDFEFADAEEKVLSPVIPLQNASNNCHVTKTSMSPVIPFQNDCGVTTNSANIDINARDDQNSSAVHNTFSPSASNNVCSKNDGDFSTVPKFCSASNSKACVSIDQSSCALQKLFSATDSPKDSKPLISSAIQNVFSTSHSSKDSHPPPPKQRKLTSIFAIKKEEPSSPQGSVHNSESLPAAPWEKTCIKQEATSSSPADTFPQDDVAHTSDNSSVFGGEKLEKFDNMCEEKMEVDEGSGKAKPNPFSTLSDNIPKAFIPPFSSSQGEDELHLSVTVSVSSNVTCIHVESVSICCLHCMN
jgi:hypothetical protein